MSPVRHLDLAALARIRSLELRAKLVIEGLWKGMHRSPYHGFSVEFSEYRPYAQGDDPRYIDWKVLARSDRTFIKKFEDETNLRCQFVVDRSRSMQFGTTALNKADYAATLAATLAYFLMQQGDAVGVTTFGPTLLEHLPARNRPGHLRRLMLELERPVAGEGTSLDLSLKQLAEVLRKRGMVCLITDLLAPLEKVERQLGYLAAMGHDVVLFHVMDRAEIDFRFDKPVHFQDIESRQERFVDPSAIRQDYLNRLNQHLEMVRNLCRRQGIEYHWVPSDRPVEEALVSFLSNRTQQGKRRRPAQSRT